MISLTNGKLIDNKGDTGYIAANRQFQFDKPPQTGAIYTDGWSVCSNGSLALGGSAVFYQCLSGNFYNIYDQSSGAQCGAIYINVIPGSSSSSGGAITSAGTASAVSTLSDGQPQATTAAVSTISDHQPQATTAGGAPISTISDHQPQATTPGGAPISTISDHQPQATTPGGGAGGAPISTISDHQPQATTPAAGAGGAPISTISDHQPQATTPAGGASSLKPISTISDHQPQAGTAATGVAAISTIADHQPQATTALASAPAFGSATRTSAPLQFTGAASLPVRASELMAFAVGAVAVAMI